MNIRDGRTVGAQVKSGLRLAGWLLLTLAFSYALLLCAGFVVGKGECNQPIYRVAGACGLVALSVAMFMTVRHWVGWFIGALCYFLLKTAVALLLGSPLVRRQLLFIEFALLLGLAILLCIRYASRKPHRIEAVGLVGVVLALSFALVCGSNNPILFGVAVLGLIQLAYGRKRRTDTLNAG